MADVQYQNPMQLMELLGLRGWEASQPRVYWGLRRPDELPAGWASPNAGLGGSGTSWGGGYGMTTGGGGGYGSSASAAGAGGFGAFGAPAAARSFQSDVGGAGAAEPGGMSTPGTGGLNAQSASLGDWLGSFTSPLTAFGSLVGQAAYNGIMGRPNQPITGLSLTSLLGLGSGEQGTAQGYGGDMGGVATSAAMGDYAGAALDAASSVGGYGGDAGYQGGGGGGGHDGYGGGGGGYDGAGAQSDAFADGGIVTPDRLTGPNPPGPDDGMAYLDVGEGILSAPEMAKIGGPRGFMMLRDLIRRS